MAHIVLFTSLLGFTLSHILYHLLVLQHYCILVNNFVCISLEFWLVWTLLYVFLKLLMGSYMTFANDFKLYYENMPVHYTEIFNVVKNQNFQ